MDRWSSLYQGHGPEIEQILRMPRQEYYETTDERELSPQNDRTHIKQIKANNELVVRRFPIQIKSRHANFDMEEKTISTWGPVNKRLS